MELILDLTQLSWLSSSCGDAVKSDWQPCQVNIYTQRRHLDDYLNIFQCKISCVARHSLGCIARLQTTLVATKKVLAARAAVCHLLHAVDTTRHASTRPESHQTEHPSNNPGHGTGLGHCMGGDAGLAVGACHPNWTKSEARGLDILDLGHHLDRGLGGHLGYWGGSHFLFTQRWIHLSRGRRSEPTSLSSSHGLVIAGRYGGHALLHLVVLKRRSTSFLHLDLTLGITKLSTDGVTGCKL